MAIKGLSKPVCGTYSNTGETVTYADPFVADKAVEYGISWTTSDNNPLYADNGIAENDVGTFQSGELTLSTADLPSEISQKILGLKPYELTFNTDKTASETVYDDQQDAPYLGFGIVELHQINDKDTYRAVFLTKVVFNLPEEAATTKGESVEWQTKTITGTIMRSDQVDSNYKHPWMIDAWFDTEDEALEYLMFKCGKTHEMSVMKQKVEEK